MMKSNLALALLGLVLAPAVVAGWTLMPAATCAQNVAQPANAWACTECTRDSAVPSDVQAICEDCAITSNYPATTYQASDCTHQCLLSVKGLPVMGCASAGCTSEQTEYVKHAYEGCYNCVKGKNTENSCGSCVVQSGTLEQRGVARSDVSSIRDRCYRCASGTSGYATVPNWPCAGCMTHAFNADQANVCYSCLENTTPQNAWMCRDCFINAFTTCQGMGSMTIPSMNTMRDYCISCGKQDPTFNTKGARFSAAQCTAWANYGPNSFVKAKAYMECLATLPSADLAWACFDCAGLASGSGQCAECLGQLKPSYLGNAWACRDKCATSNSKAACYALVNSNHPWDAAK